MFADRKKLTITEVNNLDYDEFIAIFGNVVEHCALCSAVVWGQRPFHDYDELQSQFNKFVDQLPLPAKIGVLRLYPDLAGKLAQTGDLTSESEKEHVFANLDKITDGEREKLADLNLKYKNVFGFTFVVCASENKKEAIIAGLKARLNNSVEKEVYNGTDEVKKICNYRLKDFVDKNSVAKF